MENPLPYEVVKRTGPLDEEELRSYHHRGLRLITAVQTTAEDDVAQKPRYWYYFETPDYVGK